MTDQKRLDFDDWYNGNIIEVNAMSIAEVKIRRQDLKVVLKNLHTMLREEGIADGRRKYLRGRRKFITRLLSYTKERITLFNVVAHNGVSQNIALRFVQIAAEELPQGTFQRIYGLTAMELEEKESSIKAIRDFVTEFKTQFNRDGK